MATVLLLDQVIRERVMCYDVDQEQLGENIVFHRVTAVVGSPTDADVADNRSQAHSNEYKDWMCGNDEYIGVGVQVVGAGAGPEMVSVVGTGAGTSGVVGLPPQTTGLIRFTTGIFLIGETGKRYSPRGRIYIPFPARTWMNNQGSMTAAAVPRLEAIAQTFPLTQTITQRVGHSVSLQMILRCKLNTVNVNVTTRTPLQAFATQRRRGAFGRRNPRPVGNI